MGIKLFKNRVLRMIFGSKEEGIKERLEGAA